MPVLMIGFLVYYKIITKNDLKRIKNSHFSIMANKIFNYKTINNISVIVMLFIIFSGMVISFFFKKRSVLLDCMLVRLGYTLQICEKPITIN